MRRDRWNGYRMTGYTYDATQDQRSAGGIHDYQVKRRGGQWYKRIRQANGTAESFSEPELISDEKGEELYQRAVREEKDFQKGLAKVQLCQM